MSTAQITKRIGETSSGLKARIAGILYLLIFIVAPSGAATATPAKMMITLTCDTALLAVSFRLMLVVVMAVNSLNYFGLLDLFKGAHSAAAFNTGYGMALVPFGAHCLLIGYLILKSIFLPRILGVLLVLAGLGYLIFLWPSLGRHLFFPYIALPGVIGEGSLTLWLLIIGVNTQRWTEQASAAGMHT